MVTNIIHILSISLLLNFSNQKVDYRTDYHPYITKAELAIIEADYQQALNAYEKAFAKVPHAFFNDYYNASLCATMLQKEKQAFLYLAELAKRGYTLSQIESHKVLKDLQNSPIWQDFEKNYPDYHQQHLKNFDRVYNSQIESLLQEAVQIQNKSYQQTEKDEVLFQENAALRAKFLNLIDIKGFPQEKTYANGQLTNPKWQHFLWLSIFFEVDASKEEPLGKYKAILEKAVRNGHCSPYFYALLLEGTEGEMRGDKTQGLYGAHVVLYKEGEKYYVPKRNQETLNAINDNRRALGMASLQEEQLLCKYHLEYKENKTFYIHPNGELFIRKVNRKFFKENENIEISF